MKIEKRITEDDLRKVIDEKGLCDEVVDLVNKYQLQTLKDMQATDADFEIIQPTQLTCPIQQ